MLDFQQIVVKKKKKKGIFENVQSNESALLILITIKSKAVL